MSRLVFVAALLALMPGAALAQTFALTVDNGYTDPMSGLTVAGGKVEAFKQVPSGAKRTFDVTLPDGKCEARVRARFTNGEELDYGLFDFCQYDTLAVGF